MRARVGGPAAAGGGGERHAQGEWRQRVVRELQQHLARLTEAEGASGPDAGDAARYASLEGKLTQLFSDLDALQARVANGADGARHGGEEDANGDGAGGDGFVRGEDVMTYIGKLRKKLEVLETEIADDRPGGKAGAGGGGAFVVPL